MKTVSLVFTLILISFRAFAADCPVKLGDTYLDAVSLAMDIRNGNWICGAGKRRQERRKYPQSVKIMGAYITGLQNPRVSQISLDREVPLLGIGRNEMARHG